MSDCKYFLLAENPLYFSTKSVSFDKDKLASKKKKKVIVCMLRASQSAAQLTPLIAIWWNGSFHQQHRLQLLGAGWH